MGWRVDRSHACQGGRCASSVLAWRPQANVTPPVAPACARDASTRHVRPIRMNAQHSPLYVAACLIAALIMAANLSSANGGALQSPDAIEKAETHRELERIVREEPTKAAEARKAIEELEHPTTAGSGRREQRSRRENVGRRIVKGIGTFKHPAAGALLKGSEPGSAEAWCSGTLVACDKFLTAAHCIVPNPDPKGYLVFFQNAGFFKIKDIHWPKSEYKEDSSYGDIALLTLARSVEGIAPIALNRAASPINGSVGDIVGFGRTGGDNENYGIKREGPVITDACQGEGLNKKLLCWNFSAKIMKDKQRCHPRKGLEHMSWRLWRRTIHVGSRGTAQRSKGRRDDDCRHPAQLP